MTATTSSAFTNKETVFREFLVPAGLLAEILIAAVPPGNGIKGVRPSREKFAYEIFHTLNLASCYAINPETRELGLLQSALTAFTAALSKGLLRGKATASVIAKAANTRVFANILSGAELAVLWAEMSEHLAAIRMAIDYDPGKAQAWREAQTRIATPLTRDGRINRWRTLVRNCAWAQNMGRVGMAPAQTGASPFSSRVGAEKAPDLWRETFSGVYRPAYTEPATLASADVSEIVPVVAAASSSETFRLPIGVTVNSTADGRLCVQGTFDPSDFLTSKQHQEVKKTATASLGSTELRKVLAVRKFEQLCEFPALAETLEAVRQWRVTQDSSRAGVQHAFGQWRLGELTKVVESKLKANFNAEERRVLVSLLAAEIKASVANAPA